MSLEELDAYLMSDQAPEDCMLMPELHGYLTAVAIGPEAIMPSEWLPVVWGGEEPEFSSLEEMKRVIGTILAHYNDILETLADETRVFEPVVYISKATNEPILEDWALGFARGMRLRPSGWQTLINSDEVVHVAPITAFTFDPAEHPDLTSEHVEAQKRIRDHADQMLPECLINIQRFFQRTRQHFEGGSKLGRNDPCFCGSGKKFKKCCGASRR